MSDSDPGLVTFWMPPTEVPQEKGALEGLMPEIRGTAGRWLIIQWPEWGQRPLGLRL